MKKTTIFSILIYICFANVSLAQNKAEVNEKNIFEVLKKTDTLGSGTVNVHQDQRIEKLVVDKKMLYGASQLGNGFRVQVFSSNAQRTAKNEAFRIEKNLQQVFPDNAVYVTYQSPFWKVRIGDFKTQSEAQKFRNDVIDAFPGLKSETYTVKDVINN